MKQYFGNYLGMVINSSDPEYRGRVQVFVPHIMPALYEGWNKEGRDIQISCVGSNIPAGLDPEIHDNLIKILPWAEAASPIIGSSAPGNLFSSMLAGAAAGAATGGVAGALAGAAAGATHFYNQGPTSNPVQVEGGDAQALINKAKGIADLDYDPNVSLDSSHKGGSQWGMCARGTTGLDKAAGLIDNNGPSAGFYAASHLTPARTNTTGYNPYTTGTGAKYFQPAFTITPEIQKNPTTGKRNLVGAQVGDSVFNGGGREGNGHAQKLVGIDKNGDQVWVCDNPQQSGFYGPENGYTDFTVYRLNEAGLAKYSAAIGGKVTDQQPPSSKGTENASDNTPAAPNNLSNSQGEANPAPTPQSNITAGPPGTGTPAGTVSGGGTVSETGISKEALEYAMRVAAAESGAGVQSSGAVLKEISDPLVSLGYSARSYGVKVDWTQRYSYEEVREFGKQVTQTPGFNPNKMDIGYTQNNNNDGAAYGLKNSGTYKDQILSLASHVQNQMNKKPDFAANLQNGRFAAADEMNAIPGYNITKGNVAQDKYDRYVNAKAALSDKIDSQFGGDAFAALEAIDKENPATASANEMLGTNYAPPAAGSGQNYGSSGGPTIVNNTDDGGRTPVMNTNDMANGMFAYPNPGAMVWIFFREGNPLFPVYFAASYSASEWKSAYRHGSEGELMTFEDPNVRVEASVIKPSSAFSLLSKKRINLTDPLDNESVGMIAHEHGSNITMKNGCDFYYSRNNKRDEVDNDRFIITKGYKEEWVEGDSSINIRGNMYVKIGNISAESIAAMQELANMSYEMNQKLMENPKSSGSSQLPEAFQKAVDEKKTTEKLLNSIAPDPGEFQYQSEAGSGVPAYLQPGASQETIDQFRSDSRAIQASRNQSNYIGSNNITQQGTMTTPLKGPSTFSVAPGQLRGSNVQPASNYGGFSAPAAANQPPVTIRTDNVSGKQFDVNAEKAAADRRATRNQILGR
jgi:hypothetical protein